GQGNAARRAHAGDFRPEHANGSAGDDHIALAGDAIDLTRAAGDHDQLEGRRTPPDRAVVIVVIVVVVVVVVIIIFVVIVIIIVGECGCDEPDTVPGEGSGSPF